MATDLRDTIETEQRIDRYRKAAQLLQEWLAQEDDYDSSVWTKLESELKDARTICREPDESTS